ncbi:MULTISPECIES: 1,4-alpha-glucan branching protein GlgB [unclassified Coleofasciculus]|uniref:1,4-alpha-glucan branching protein GlgB n=1 Tax=unclassified Coleofasciculus TaxID=2692782 RepID=UPI0018812C7D|nr:MULTISPECIES: 1,4-alpha-glucan branching protein GlgB [unclassified Coleofasciculus]MBE9128104.1 1,4-alpha-glucan branching protein GlgB [Coleofasciculus sp. LEGE 07081]MBE9152067.1 1,4-alpha-glucan branching protein GlgB [Coleofasciculus sp. LEGE 07092]
MTATQIVNAEVTLFTDDDLYLFNEGSHFGLYEKLGSHSMVHDGVEGTYFAVWAPNAAHVSVKGDFNQWNKDSHPLRVRGNSGIWEGFIADVTKGTVYKYHITSYHNGYEVEKADPVALNYEVPPKTASVVWDSEYTWNDSEWMEKRYKHNALDTAISIYEVHTGSWMRVSEDGNRSLSYRELAPKLAEYIQRMGFTHVELLPITEHPFFGSWGYQTTGFFAPTSRYGTLQDFMYLVDYLHQHDIGIILDWVPSHFPVDQHGLSYFDGTHLYEHSDPRQGYHPDWGSSIFNYGRHEVSSFIISSAFFWLEKCHIDGLRVDAVASMLYLDYSRKQGEWIPNQFGSNENLEAIAFLRRFNTAVYERFPDVTTIAEESTSWSMVSRPTYVGGLGFGMKWDMGWMHDTLDYMSHDPIHRKFHHNKLTFRMLYAFNENFLLPLSHDEVVHGKGSLIGKMPGDYWQKFANLRSLFGYMYAQPAKKLMFMGCEFGQWSEWKHDDSLDWHLLESPLHAGLQNWVADLNRVYREELALHELDFDPKGFDWIDCNDTQNSTISLIRKGSIQVSGVKGEVMESRIEPENWNPNPEGTILVVCNFTPLPRFNYRVGVPAGGFWQELLNSDAGEYGGSGLGNLGGVQAEEWAYHGRPYSINITLPPLAVVFFKGLG